MRSVPGMYCCFLDVGCFVQLNGWVGSFVFSSDIVDSLEGHSHNRTGIFKKKNLSPTVPDPGSDGRSRWVGSQD